MTTKNEILEYLDNVLHPLVSPEHWNVYSELHDMVEDLPSAEPKHGKWIEEGIWSEGSGMGEIYGRYWRCSSCNEITKDDYYQCGANFCPNCGADMRELE